MITYPAAVPPEHDVGYVPAADEAVYVLVQISPVRVTPFTDGEPVIVGAAAPTVTVCDEAVTVRETGAAKTVKLKVRELDPEMLVAVMVYVVAD